MSHLPEDDVMRILLIAPPHVHVARNAAGPGGQIALLTEGLTARGHNVTVFTSEPCEVAADIRRCSLPAAEDGGDPGRLARFYAVRALAAANGFDLVHSFAGADVAAQSAAASVPLLATLWETPDKDTRAAWHRFTGVYTTVSWAQATRIRDWLPNARLAGAVYPALPVDELPYEPEKDGYLIAPAPIGPGGGTDIALAAARKAEVPLVVIGPVAPGAAGFFEQEVASRIDGRLVRCLPAASAEERRGLLARACGLLLTARVARPWEPAAAEALAMGTPVVALDHGPARELVVHAETGFIADDLTGLVSGIDRLDTIDPRACRRRAQHCWDVAQVTAAHERVYAAMLAGGARGAFPLHPELEALDPREPVAV